MSNDMQNDRLQALRELQPDAPSKAARQRALAAAQLAFDAEQQKSANATKGSGWRARLRSIVPKFEGNWIMDTRIPFGLGTAAVALLLLPLGYQLYSSTAITPPTTAPAQPPELVTLDAPAPVAEPALQNKQAAGSVAADQEVRRMSTMPMAESTASAPLAMQMPAPAPMLVAPTVPSGDSFAAFDESPLKLVADEPVSTFSIDVDTASYAYVRRLLRAGQLPEPDAVRVEELLNYFNYDYPAPENAAMPFRTSLELYPSPWNAQTQLLQIGIKGYVPPAGEDRASNLVFLLDTSGSMNAPDKLPLLKRAFGLLVDQLSDNDTVAIVAYAGSAGVVLEPTSASDKATILSALEHLDAGGSTAGAEGIELAYRLAEQHLVDDGVNRVILATDGDFNVGIADPDKLTDFIAARRDAGISLSVLGFGQGNLDDATMQALAQHGNGNASYIDSYREAQKVLVEELGGTLQTIAKDVKIQVEFNPAAVAEYRLVGYETRALARQDFNNDKVDAGEIGAGHTVTALYEITPVGSGAELIDPLRYGETPPPTGTAAADEIGFLKLRYKLPQASDSTLVELPITTDLAVADLAAASDDARWAAAVAAFGQKLKGSDFGGDLGYAEIRELAQGARGADARGYRAEFLQLLDSAAALSTGD